MSSKPAGKKFLLVPPPNGDMYAPIVLFIAGAGGMNPKDAPNANDLPLPSWSVAVDIKGNYKMRRPKYLSELL